MLGPGRGAVKACPTMGHATRAASETTEILHRGLPDLSDMAASLQTFAPLKRKGRPRGA